MNQAVVDPGNRTASAPAAHARSTVIGFGMALAVRLLYRPCQHRPGRPAHLPRPPPQQGPDGQRLLRLPPRLLALRGSQRLARRPRWRAAKAPPPHRRRLVLLHRPHRPRLELRLHGHHPVPLRHGRRRLLPPHHQILPLLAPPAGPHPAPRPRLWLARPLGAAAFTPLLVVWVLPLRQLARSLRPLRLTRHHLDLLLRPLVPRHDPQQHPAVNAEEKLLLRDLSSAPGSSHSVPWRRMLGSRSRPAPRTPSTHFLSLLLVLLHHLASHFPAGARAPHLRPRCLLLHLPCSFFCGLGSLFSGFDSRLLRDPPRRPHPCSPLHGLHRLLHGGSLPHHRQPHDHLLNTTMAFMARRLLLQRLGDPQRTGLLYGHRR